MLCGLWTLWQIPAAILVTHASIDFVKAKSKKVGPYAFMIDQAAHGVVIVVLAALLVGQIESKIYWVGLLGRWYLKALILISGAVATVKMGGFLIGAAVRPIQERMYAHKKTLGLDDAVGSRGI